MMNDRQIIDYCMNSLADRGADKSQVVLTRTDKHELNVDTGELSLLRTTYDTTLGLTSIRGNKKGSTSINKTSEPELDDAVDRVLELLETSTEDEAYDIAPRQEPGEFSRGRSEPDFERMYDAFHTFLVDLEARYQGINLFLAFLDFEHSTKRFVNSNGVDFLTSQGVYHLVLAFASRDGRKTTSFSELELSLPDLERDLLELDLVRTSVEQSIEHLEARPLVGKFTGDVVITPQALADLLSTYARIFLGNQALISGTSRLKDKLNEQVASPKLTVHSKPVSDEICDGYFVTPDGFAAENVTLIEDGILRSFLLDQYGANKTGRERARTAGDAYVVEPGTRSLDDLIGDIDRGLLVTRYSGGYPNSNGDFSGVAKNSFYIEDGAIQYPVTETMISGNLLDVFENLNDVSRERTDFGMAVLPWVSAAGVTISGK